MYRQGDVLLIPVEQAPTYKEDAKEGSKVEQRGSVVLALGEKTGHKHVIEGPDVLVMQGDTLLPYRKHDVRTLIVETEAFLRHNTHGEITVPKGVYEVRQQREMPPLGDIRKARPVID